MSRAALLASALIMAVALGVSGGGRSASVYDKDALLHFWDDTDLSDTAAVGSRGPVAALFADYAAMLGQVDSIAAFDAVSTLLGQASVNPDVYRGVLDIAERCLYDPAAPTVNEEAYLPFIKCALADTLIYPEDRIRMEQWITQIYRNRQGSAAADFTYIGRDGEEHTLYATAPEVRYRLLVFYDPDCPHCLEAIAAVQSNASIARAVADGTMALIAIYADGDPDIWQRSRNQLPDCWIAGYTPDGAIENDEIYDLRAMPTLYLLSGNVVELKDIYPGSIPDLVVR